MQPAFSIISRALHIKPLLSAITSYPELWTQITARQYTVGSAHQDTETIFLRWAKLQTIEAVFKEIEAVDYPALNKLYPARALIAEAMRLTHSKELGRVIITKLKPNGFIDPHIDEGDYADHYERFHIPLQSEGDNSFFVEHEPGHAEVLNMKPGNLVWFNHKKRHWVMNASQTDRIHLIIDAVAPLFKVPREK